MGWSIRWPKKPARGLETPIRPRTPPSRRAPANRLPVWVTKADRPWENGSLRMNAAIPERRPATEEISGVIERVTFHNEENGFCVLRVKTKGDREAVYGSI